MKKYFLLVASFACLLPFLYRLSKKALCIRSSGLSESDMRIYQDKTLMVINFYTNKMTASVRIDFTVLPVSCSNYHSHTSVLTGFKTLCVYFLKIIVRFICGAMILVSAHTVFHKKNSNRN